MPRHTLSKRQASISHFITVDTNFARRRPPTWRAGGKGALASLTWRTQGETQGRHWAMPIQHLWPSIHCIDGGETGDLQWGYLACTTCQLTWGRWMEIWCLKAEQNLIYLNAVALSSQIERRPELPACSLSRLASCHPLHPPACQRLHKSTPTVPAC